MEIGFRDKCSDAFIEDMVGDLVSPEKCKLAVMVPMNDLKVEDFLPSSQSKISMIRVWMAYHGFKNKADCEVVDWLSLKRGILKMNQLVVDKNYEVCFNLGKIDKVSEEQLLLICKVLNESKIQYFYLADTFGSLDEAAIELLIPKIVDTLKKEIQLGFHAHDNFCNGTTKAIFAAKKGCSIIDGCIMGFGKGAGNAKMELLMMELNRNHGHSFNFIPIIQYGNTHIKSYKECGSFSYNVIYALTAYLGCHNSLGTEIIHENPEMSISTIYSVLTKLRQNNQHIFFQPRLFLDVCGQHQNKA
jgi:4-hydroxy 2-oxovalerate aldolase